MNYDTEAKLLEKQAEFAKELKLKYTRKECKMVASWMNGLALKVENSCEQMHPKRGMWIRFIRALRLAEYSKKKEFSKLKELLDVFYNRRYSVWQGELNKARLSLDEEQMFRLLKEKPSIFARSLFSTMLWFGAEKTLVEFKQVSKDIPARLLATLSMYASLYFDEGQNRVVKPLGGSSKRIGMNASLKLYTKEQLEAMVSAVEAMFLEEMSRRYATLENENKSCYIDELLFKIPLAIGDRSEMVQDCLLYTSPSPRD